MAGQYQWRQKREEIGEISKTKEKRIEKRKKENPKKSTVVKMKRRASDWLINEEEGGCYGNNMSSMCISIGKLIT